MKAPFGGTRITGGDVLLDGKSRTIKTPMDAIRQGIMLCPKDRKADGIIPVHSVRDNINISARRKSLKAGFVINNQWEEENAER